MRVATLVKDYAKLSDTSLAFRSQAVGSSLTGNAYFPVTSPTLAAYSAVVTAFFNAIEAAIGGDRTAIALKRQARTDLLLSMRLLATNIESLAEADRAKLISSGFLLASEGESVPPLANPADYRLTDGVNPGEVRSMVRAVPNAVTYLHEYTEEPVTAETRWITEACTSRECIFTGLPVGRRIYARVAAIGRKGQKAYSTVQTRVVQ